MADQELKLPMHSRGWLALALAGIVACTAGSVYATSQWFNTPSHNNGPALAQVHAPVTHTQTRAEDDVMLARALRATALPPVLEARGPIVTGASVPEAQPATAAPTTRRRARGSQHGRHAQQARYESAPAFASVDTSTLR